MATKKSSGKGKVSAVGHNVTKLQLEMPVDAKKVEAIQRCIKKGTLKISLSKVNLATGRLGGGWLYD